MKRKQPRWRTWRDDFILRIFRDGHATGYDVRLPEAHGLPHKYFGILRWGTLREALRQARWHRDALVRIAGEAPRRLDKQGHRVPSYLVKPRSNNTSGLVGVTTTDDGAYWVAWYQPQPNKQAKRRFSIKKYGFEGALILASEWREKMIKAMR